jgi:hypothetical protein
MAQDLQLWQPQTDLSKLSDYERSVAKVRYSTSRLNALENAKKLVGHFPNGRAEDGYINGLADIFEEYPLGIVEECCHITRGIARVCGDFLPSPQRVIDWCELRLGAAQNLIRIGPQKPPRPESTAEEMTIGRRALTKLAAWMKAGFQGSPPTWSDAVNDTKLLPPPEIDLGGLFQRMPADTAQQAAE